MQPEQISSTLLFRVISSSFVEQTACRVRSVVSPEEQATAQRGASVCKGNADRKSIALMHDVKYLISEIRPSSVAVIVLPRRTGSMYSATWPTSGHVRANALTCHLECHKRPSPALTTRTHAYAKLCLQKRTVRLARTRNHEGKFLSVSPGRHLVHYAVLAYARELLTVHDGEI